jgi:nucleoside-diphosphate-sugar epimerase
VTSFPRLWLLAQERKTDDTADHPADRIFVAGHLGMAGGIQVNNSYPADFLLENLKIQLNVIETAWRSQLPTNLYGPGDNYHRDNSHVLPALIRRS